MHIEENVRKSTSSQNCECVAPIQDGSEAFLAETKQDYRIPLLGSEHCPSLQAKEPQEMEGEITQRKFEC